MIFAICENFTDQNVQPGQFSRLLTSAFLSHLAITCQGSSYSVAARLVTELLLYDMALLS